LNQVLAQILNTSGCLNMVRFFICVDKWLYTKELSIAFKVSFITLPQLAFHVEYSGFRAVWKRYWHSNCTWYRRKSSSSLKHRRCPHSIIWHHVSVTIELNISLCSAPAAAFAYRSFANRCTDHWFKLAWRVSHWFSGNTPEFKICHEHPFIASCPDSVDFFFNSTPPLRPTAVPTQICAASPCIAMPVAGIRSSACAPG
jgi:hypothetical protein